MIYAYVAVHFNHPHDVLQEIQKFATEQGIKIDQVIQDQQDNTVNWSKRDIAQLIGKLKKGDQLLVYEASNLARSTHQVLEVLESIIATGADVFFVKYDQAFPRDKHTDTNAFIELVQQIDSDFVAKRTTDAMAERRKKGLNVGRPLGRKNTVLKLDKHREDIQKYLDLGVSRASIAKLIACNPQTLYNYIEKRQLKPNKRVDS